MAKKYEHLIYSAIGLVALVLVLVAFNYLISRVPARLDLTEGRLYTLSEGTKKILRNLQAPVKVKLYVSQGESVPVPLRSFAQRVEDLVREFKSVAGANLVIERYNPRPDSEEEDAAQLDGIESQQLVSGEQFYLGATVSQLDRKQALAAINPQRERLLEYDLVRAIARVGASERPKIGLMAGLPVLGEKFNPITRQSREPRVLAGELKREFDVKEVPFTAKEIDKDVNVLLLIHPRDIQPEQEYALDQFVLRGGKLIVFVDPYAYFDQAPQMPGVPPMPSSSNLPTLFKAWGVEYDPNKVISDVVFGSGGGARGALDRQIQDRLPGRLERRQGQAGRRHAGAARERQRQLRDPGRRRRHAGRRRRGRCPGNVRPQDRGALERQPRLRARHGRAVRRRRRADLAAQPGERLPAAYGGARARSRGAEAVLRQDPGAGRRAAKDQRQAARTARTTNFGLRRR